MHWISQMELDLYTMKNRELVSECCFMIVTIMKILFYRQKGGPSGGDETVEASMKLVENPCPAWIAFEKKVLRFYGYFRAPAGNDIVMRR